MASRYWQQAFRQRVSRRAFVAGSGGALAGVAGLAAGCGGGGDDPKGTTGAPASATPGASGTTNPPGKRGGTLRISGPSKYATFDPHDRVTHWPHLAKVYTNLVLYQFSSAQVLFDGATKVEQPDPTTLRFTLRDGMRFHDGVANGRAVTAADAAYSINRIREQATRPGPLASSQMNSLYWDWIERAESPDDRTLVIKQAYPYGSALPTLGALGFAIVAKEVIDASGGLLKADSAGKDAGSGPYTLTKIEDGGYTWERWPKYWKHLNPSPTFVENGPYIDKIQWRQLGDASAAEAAFRAGDLDMLGSVTGASGQISWDTIKADELAKVSGVQVARAQNARTLIGAWDNYTWADPRIRQAASMAIDRDALISKVYLGDGVIGAPIPPPFKEFALADSQLRSLQAYDPRQAKLLWDAAGGNSSVPLVTMLTQASIPLFVQLTNFIAEEWRKNLGANVRVDSVDSATFVKRATDTSRAQKDWDFCITSDPFLLTIPETNGLSLYAPSGYGGNFGNLQTGVARTADLAKRLQSLYDAQVRELDPQARKTKMDTLQVETMKAFAPGLPIPIARTDYAAYRDWVKNFPDRDFHMGSATAGPIRAQDLWLDRP